MSRSAVTEVSKPSAAAPHRTVSVRSRNLVGGVKSGHGFQARSDGFVRRSPLVSHDALGLALAICTLYSDFLGKFHRVLIPLAIILFLTWTSLIYERRKLGKTVFGQVVLLAIYLLLILQVGKSVASAQGPAAGIEFERVLGLLPLAAACGWLLVRSGRIVMYLRWYLGVGLFTVALAIYEYLSNSQVLRSGAASYVRNGHTRAVVGADHPLVLAAFFVGMIPVAMYVLPKWRRVAAIWLFLGVLSTGSNGPSAIAAALLIICLVPPIGRFITRSVKPVTVFCVALAAYLVVGSAFLWSTELTATNVNRFSNEYRAGLYYMLPRLLETRPLGYGWGGLPDNTWYFSTAVGGIKDVAASIDSELVFSASQYGLLGVAFFLFALVISILALVKHQSLGLSFLAVTLAGLFLAIHSWDSLGVYWFFFGGACCAVVFDSGGTTVWRGLSERVGTPVPSARRVGDDIVNVPGLAPDSGGLQRSTRAVAAAQDGHRRLNGRSRLHGGSWIALAAPNARRPGHPSSSANGRKS